MKTIFVLFVCLILSGCATQLDPGTVFLLSKRIEELETIKKPKLTEHRTEIEVYSSSDNISDVVNLNDKRKFKLEVIIDSDGNFIIPKDKIINRYELKTEK